MIYAYVVWRLGLVEAHRYIHLKHHISKIHVHAKRWKDPSHQCECVVVDWMTVEVTP